MWIAEVSGGKGLGLGLWELGTSLGLGFVGSRQAQGSLRSTWLFWALIEASKQGDSWFALSVSSLDLSSGW